MNKKQKIKETYIYDNIDLNNIKYEESTLDQELVKINQKIKETYEIDPRVLDIEYKIEKEYNDKKIMEQKFLDRISKERSLEKKINETFGQKTKIIEPYYQFSNKINENKIDIRSDQNTPEKTLKKRDFISENKDYNIIEPYSKKYFSISKPERVKLNSIYILLNSFSILMQRTQIKK